MAWQRSVCYTELAKEFLEEEREGELLGEGREEELLEEREEVKKTAGDILEEVIFHLFEKSEKNSVVRYSHFYHPLANSEDISRMTGTLEVVFLLTKIDPGEEGPGELQEGVAGRLQHLSAP